MLLGDLGTIATYDLPVKVIVFNNGLLDMGQWEMPAEGFGPFQTDLKNPDFAKLADAYGILGIGVGRSSPRSTVAPAPRTQRACPRPEDRPPSATHPSSYPCGQAGNDTP
jgi:thiamine pyrophosphate-dependent acetolactate synthase large subunit-like protein